MTYSDMTILVTSKVQNVVKNYNTFFLKKSLSHPLDQSSIRKKKNNRTDYAF